MLSKCKTWEVNLAGFLKPVRFGNSSVKKVYGIIVAYREDQIDGMYIITIKDKNENVIKTQKLIICRNK